MFNLIQFISLFLMFSAWGLGVEQQTRNPVAEIPCPEEEQQSRELVYSSLPTLRNFINFEDFSLEDCTWEEHLEKVGHLFYFFQAINSSNSSLFNSKKINDPNLQLNLLDLKIIADLLLNYEPESLWTLQNKIPFVCIICDGGRQNISCNTFHIRKAVFDQRSCLWVNNQSCYSLNCQAKSNNYLRIEAELIEIKKQLNLSPSLFAFKTLFLYCETGCCHIVHQVKALIIVKISNNTFKVYHLDSSGRKFSDLDDLVLRLFTTPLSLLPYRQQPIGIPDDLSGLLVFVNVKLLLRAFARVEQFNEDLVNLNTIFPSLPSDFDGYRLFQGCLKNALIQATFNSLYKKLSFNLLRFGFLFSQRREAILLVRDEKLKKKENKSVTFQAVKGVLIEEQDYFEGILDQLEKFFCGVFQSSDRLFFSFEEAKKAIVIMSKKLRKEFPPQSLDNDSFISLVSHLKSELSWIERGDYSSAPSCSPHLIPFTDLPKEVNLSAGSTKKNISTIESSALLPFPFIIRRFLSPESSIISPRIVTGTALNLRALYRLVLALEEITNFHWNNSKHLFSSSFLPTRMLSSNISNKVDSFDESQLLARLVCGFQREHTFNELSQCFLEHECLTSKEKKSCNHCRDPFDPEGSNRLFISSPDCFTARDDAILSKKVWRYFDEYSKFCQQSTHSEKISPLVIFGRCVTTCCQSIHQSWSLVISFFVEPKTYQAFYYNPSGRLGFSAVLSAMVLQKFKTQLNSFTKPQQPSNSLDFSGVLAICGTKVIIDSLSQTPLSPYQMSKIKNELSISFSSDEDPSHQDYLAQEIVKDRLVIVTFYRLFNRFFRDADRYILEARKVELDEVKDEVRWLTSFTDNLKESFHELFGFDIPSSTIEFKEIRSRLLSKDFKELVKFVFSSVESRRQSTLKASIVEVE